MTIRIINPLPAALSHYTREVISTLAVSASHDLSLVRAARAEGGDRRLDKLLKLKAGGQNLFTSASSRSPMLQTWTTFGLLDARLLSSGRTRHAVVLHDVRPIEPLRGYSARSAKWAARARPSRAPYVIVHSPEAAQEAAALLPTHEVRTIPHPIMQGLDFADPAGHTSDDSTLLVAGQYKPERDVELMIQLAPRLKHLGWSCRVVGRGWPPLPGWLVQNAFVDEATFEREIRSATVLLLPYRRFYQSGVAVRALEMGRLTVGPQSGFIAELLGRETPLAYDGEGVAAAEHVERILASMSHPVGLAAAAYRRYAVRAAADWKALADLLE